MPLFPVTDVRRRWARIAIALVCTALLAAGVVLVTRSRKPRPRPQPVFVSRAEEERRRLFAEIQPVTLANCELERFGEDHDGGYMLCRNLLGGAKAAYSYGISGYDQWGCDVSTRLGAPVHEYDCFNLTRPVCATGKLVFHGECIGNSRRTEDGRPFDTLENQVGKNGDAGKNLVVKMDVEGAEWDSFLSVSDEILQRIDQMDVEFHGLDQGRFLLAMRKLKAFFHIANLHWNNYACGKGNEPFTSWAYEILFVNKRLGVPNPAKPVVPNLLDRPNNPTRPDCQAEMPR